jgi:shikimate kinase
MSIVLIGYRGSGKTTVGRLLAQRLGKPFADADDLVVQRSGKSIREIFASGGEETFRTLEMAAIAELAGRNDGVIAVGGGAVLRDDNRRVLAGHTIVYLRCEVPELLRRIQSDPATSDNRPNLTSLGGGIDEIQALLRQREPIYKAAMTHELDVTSLTPAEAVDRLHKLIGRSN